MKNKIFTVIILFTLTAILLLSCSLKLANNDVGNTDAYETGLESTRPRMPDFYALEDFVEYVENENLQWPGFEIAVEAYEPLKDFLSMLDIQYIVIPRSNLYGISCWKSNGDALGLCVDIEYNPGDIETLRDKYNASNKVDIINAKTNQSIDKTNAKSMVNGIYAYSLDSYEVFYMVSDNDIIKCGFEIGDYIIQFSEFDDDSSEITQKLLNTNTAGDFIKSIDGTLAKTDVVEKSKN